MEPVIDKIIAVLMESDEDPAEVLNGVARELRRVLIEELSNSQSRVTDLKHKLQQLNKAAV